MALPTMALEFLVTGITDSLERPGLQRLHDGFEEQSAIRAAERGLASPFRMRHEPDDVAALVAEAGNAMDRSIGIGIVRHCPRRIAIAKHDLPVSIQSLDDIWRRKVVAFTMCDWNAQHLSGPTSSREGRVGFLDPNVHVLAVELEIRAFRSMAPGSSPASSRIWNPLHTPSTGPPWSANAVTAGMIGENLAIAPVRR